MVTGKSKFDSLSRPASVDWERVKSALKADWEQTKYERLGASDGTENPYQLHKELGEVMLRFHG